MAKRKLREWYLVKTGGVTSDGRLIEGCLEAMTKRQAEFFFAKEGRSRPNGRGGWRDSVIVPGKIRGILVREVKEPK